MKETTVINEPTAVKEVTEQKIKEVKSTNWGVIILLILGLSTIIFPLYMAVVIALKQPSEMTNSIKGILSLPEHFSFSNFSKAMEVTDFWHSMGYSLLITILTVDYLF